MKARYLLTVLGAVSFLVGEETASGQIATITKDVATEFGVYHPYLVTVSPAVEAYTIRPDFSEVTNFSKQSGSLTEADKRLLEVTHFVAKPSHFKQIYSLYNDNRSQEIPSFVTVDAMLHTFHILYDYTLRVLELNSFVHDLQAMDKELLNYFEQQFRIAPTDSLREILRKGWAYFGVSTRLLDPADSVQNEIAALVDAELALIEAHQGFASSPIFGFAEDYSQYVPRGHYTRNETFKRYFKSMMWHGRIGLRVKEKDETLLAILITQALYNLSVNGSKAITVWDRIYQPTVFFVGKADDLTPYEYADLLRQVYGNQWLTLTPQELSDEQKLAQFIEAAKKLRNPYINSGWLTDQQNRIEETKSFRFMGQRFIPDSYMFQQLVYDQVGAYRGAGHPFTLVMSDGGPIRGFPRGLDVMAVLGSERALEILKAEGDTEYDGYFEQLDSLRTEFAQLPAETWAQNLYWNWLYTLLPLFEPKGKGYPYFEQTTAWADKTLVSVLGSWAELRHDTILYAKQSYTVIATGVRPPPAPPIEGWTYGYVEPEPNVFARLAALANFMIDGLDSRGLLLPEFKQKLLDFKGLTLQLKAIAEKELSGDDITIEEYTVVWKIGKTMEEMLTFSDQVEGQITNETDEEMAVIADVHTDTNSMEVLEVAVGYPMELYVITPFYGNLQLAKGAIFSYDEFKQPMSDRLTDEEWQARLTAGSLPSPQQWQGSFLDLQSLSGPHSYGLSFAPANEGEGVIPRAVELEQNYPNPFNPGTTLRYELPAGGNLTLKIYNTLGQLVRTLVSEYQTPGIHEVYWDGSDDHGQRLGSGVYFAVLEMKDVGLRITRKTILLK
jgi:hypothetical protein